MAFLKMIFVLVITLISTSTWAQLDSYNQEALEKTKKLLKNKYEREAVIENTPAAQKYENQMKSMGMDETQKNQVYNMSSDVFESLIQANGGDAQAVEKLLKEAQKNPKAFYDQLDPSIKSQIKSLSSELEDGGLFSPK